MSNKQLCVALLSAGLVLVTIQFADCGSGPARSYGLSERDTQTGGYRPVEGGNAADAFGYENPLDGNLKPAVEEKETALGSCKDKKKETDCINCCSKLYQGAAMLKKRWWGKNTCYCSRRNSLFAPVALGVDLREQNRRDAENDFVDPTSGV